MEGKCIASVGKVYAKAGTRNKTVGQTYKPVLLESKGKAWGDALSHGGIRISPLHNQSILKEITPEYSLEGLMLKLKLQYFRHLMRRANSLEKALRLGEIKGGIRRGWRGWDCWMASPPQWTWVCANSETWRTGKPGVLQSMGPQRVRRDWATEQHGNHFLLIEWKINYNFVEIWGNRWIAFREKIYFLIHMKPSVKFTPIFNQM